MGQSEFEEQEAGSASPRVDSQNPHSPATTGDAVGSGPPPPHLPQSPGQVSQYSLPLHFPSPVRVKKNMKMCTSWVQMQVTTTENELVSTL